MYNVNERMERNEAPPVVEPPKVLSDEEKAELKELLKIAPGMRTWGEAARIKDLELQLKA